MTSRRMAVSTSNAVVGRRFAHVAVNMHAWVYAGAVLCLIAAFGFVYLIQSGHVARQVEDMEELEQDVQRLKQENSALLLEIAQFEQVARIKQRARQLGFSEPESVQYVVVRLEETTSRPQTGAGPSAQGAPATDLLAPAFQGDWLRTLLNQLSDWMRVSPAPQCE